MMMREIHSPESDFVVPDRSVKTFEGSVSPDFTTGAQHEFQDEECIVDSDGP